MFYVLDTPLKKKYLSESFKAVYGLGKSLSNSLCEQFGFQKNFKVENLTEEDINMITQHIEKSGVCIKGNLMRKKKETMDMLKQNKFYRGLRLRKGFPVRGQRTHTNSKTVKKFVNTK